jgi:hypothetical protein
MRELLEELAAPALTKPNVALAFVAPAGLKEVQAALGSEVRWLACTCSMLCLALDPSMCSCSSLPFRSADATVAQQAAPGTFAATCYSCHDPSSAWQCCVMSKCR